jgi:glycerol-3-phosphate dehydrogenase
MSGEMELSFRTRQKNLERLSREKFDLLVIGGGITGAGVARDAALRGLSVALIERKDFAAGTSSRSSKLVHGGLRYLQQGDIGLVREAATERYVLRRLAPHLVRPTQILVPVNNRRNYAKIKLGLWTYERLARVAEAEQYRMIGREKAVEMEPTLRPDALYGAGLYYEYLTDDARLVVEVIKSAAELGAVVVNRVEVTGFRLEDGRVAGVTLRDSITGAEIDSAATVVINAAGPWVDLVRLLCEPGEKPRLRLTKGIHIVLRREQLPVSRIVIMNARDRRGVFAIPHGAVTYVGTTDTFCEEPDDYPGITMDDVTYLLEAVTRTFAVHPLGPDDVIGAWAGLRPLLAEKGKEPSEISRKDEIMVSPSGLLSIAGGKLTTFRRMAERIVGQAAERLREAGHEIPERLGASDEMPLGGGRTGDDVAAYAERLKSAGFPVDGDVIDHLVALYGSDTEHMLESLRNDTKLAERCALGLPVIRAEVRYTVQREMAMTLEDFLERRSRLLLWDPHSGVRGAATVARWMAAELGWSAERIEHEVAGYRALVTRLRTFESDETAEEAQVAEA